MDKSKKKKLLIIGIIAIATTICGTIFFLTTHDIQILGSVSADITKDEPVYSILTGREISDAALNSSPTYCVQIPNGSTDGARPQAGLGDAAIIFEAVAEMGITRFAAVFQNPTVSAIGPIRSLRPYYLDWDTPFECTVVHSGGSQEALQAIAAGGQRNLDESLTYMWRESGTPRSWNNLFTSSKLLSAFNTDSGYTTSNPAGFPHLTPSAVTARLETNCDKPEDAGDDYTPPERCYAPRATSISLRFSTNYGHNVDYTYDAESNTYKRSHQDGTDHVSYECPADLDEPDTTRDCGDPVQLAPSVVIAMRVSQTLMADGYHQQIQTTGSGKATVFQNGEVISASWQKSAQDSQLVFSDTNGKKINFTPGQIWISAIPTNGSIDYE